MNIRLAFHDAAALRPSANGSLFDRLIEWRTGSSLVHVELVLTDSNDTSALCYSATYNQGVRYERIDITQPCWLVVPVATATAEDCDRLVTIERQYLNHRYDWLGILGFALPFGEHDDEDKFCSEVCCKVLQDAFGLFPHVKSWTVSPADLYRMVTQPKPSNCTRDAGHDGPCNGWPCAGAIAAMNNTAT